MNEQSPRLIKKYPNRRLYDTSISSYITLEDVRKLIINQVPIKVIDARSQNDITHSTLLQIIIEQEENGPALFTTDSLQQMIRFYGGEMQQILQKMFAQGMELFSKQIFVKPTSEQPNDVADGFRAMNDLAQNNMRQWQQLQQQWMQNLSTYQSGEWHDRKETESNASRQEVE